MSEVDRKLGGFRNGLRKFFSFFPAEMYECRVKLVAVIMDSGKWKLPIARRRKSPSLAGFAIANEAVVLSKDGCHVELSFQKGIPGCTVEMEGKASVVLNASCFESAATALWTRIDTLFHPKP